MDVQRDFATINGARLYYEVAGNGPSVALLHGFTLDTRMWDDQFPALAAHYRVVRYDLRGFGRSDLPSGEPYAHTDDLRALLEYLGLGPAAVVGLSMGGGVAADFALAQPDLTRALVLIDAAISGYRWPTGWDEEIRRGAREQGFPVAKERWLAHGLFVPASEQPAVGARLAAIVADYSGWHWVNRNPIRSLEPPAIDRLGEIAAPTLAIVGERDLADFHAIEANLREQAPQAQIVVVPGVGHMANMEAPEEVNRHLLAFLREVL